eukprot:3219984-Prymnesium_polylepis.1
MADATEAVELVVITGVTSGLGEELFRRFSKLPGYAVAGCGRRADRLEALRKGCDTVGSKNPHTLHCVDVADDQAVAEWAKVCCTNAPPPVAAEVHAPHVSTGRHFRAQAATDNRAGQRCHRTARGA